MKAKLPYYLSRYGAANMPLGSFTVVDKISFPAITTGTLIIVTAAETEKTPRTLYHISLFLMSFQISQFYYCSIM